MNPIHGDEALRRPFPVDPTPRGGPDGGGPQAPDVNRPDTRQLLERMRRVDPDQARRYRQRSGQ